VEDRRPAAGGEAPRGAVACGEQRTGDRRPAGDVARCRSNHANDFDRETQTVTCPGQVIAQSGARSQPCHLRLDAVVQRTYGLFKSNAAKNSRALAVQPIPMKASPTYASIAAILALVGALALVAVYYPMLNPEQFSLDSGQDSAPLGRYLFGTPASLFILAAAWHFNCQAMRKKQQEKEEKLVNKPLD